MLCVDEKTSLQPRPRKSPTLAAQPERPVRVEHEYGRCGALNLFAAFDTRTGKVYGMTAERKRQAEFIAFLEQLDREIPATVTTIHVVLDNLRMHKGKQVQAWLAKHPRFVFHHPPVHCSWMNQVEQWFSILQRKRLRIADFADKARVGGAAAGVHPRVESSGSSVQLDHEVGGEGHGQVQADRGPSREEPTRGGVISIPFLCGVVLSRDGDAHGLVHDDGRACERSRLGRRSGQPLDQHRRQLAGVEAQRLPQGEKRPTTLRAIPPEFGEGNRAVHRRHRALIEVPLARGPAPGTRGSGGLLSDHRLEVPLLDRAAESLPQLESPQLNRRIVGHPLDRPVGSIEGDRDFRSFGEQRREFLSKFVGLPLQGDPPKPGTMSLQATMPRVTYHKSVEFPNILRFRRDAGAGRKLTCTRRTWMGESWAFRIGRFGV